MMFIIRSFFYFCLRHFIVRFLYVFFFNFCYTRSISYYLYISFPSYLRLIINFRFFWSTFSLQTLWLSFYFLANLKEIIFAFLLQITFSLVLNYIIWQLTGCGLSYNHLTDIMAVYHHVSVSHIHHYIVYLISCLVYKAFPCTSI